MGTHVCPWWFAYTFDNPLRALFHKPEQMFKPYVAKDMTVADIGCGMGYFSIGLARMVQKSGKVIAVDLQAKMLKKLKQRAQKAGVSDIIELVQCEKDHLNIRGPVDFALAFWMIHETPDPKNFFAQVHAALKPGGFMMTTEPKFHVSSSEFNKQLNVAEKIGFKIKEAPAVKFSYAKVLEK